MAYQMETTVFTSYRFWAFDSLVGALVLTRLTPEYSIKQSLLLTTIVLFLAQWFVYSFYAVIIYPRFLSPLRNLPTVKKGNGFIDGQWRVLIKQPSGVPMRRFINEVPNDGLIRYLHLWNRERVLPTSPKALAEILTSKSYDFAKPDFLRSNVGRILGFGILFAEGDDHKLQRKNLSPAFSFRHIKELYPVFWRKSREMVERIEQSWKQSPDDQVDMADWGSRATLDIIGIAGMGQDFNALADPGTELNKVYRSIFTPTTGAKILGVLQFFLPGWLIHIIPIKHNNNIVTAAATIRETARRLIKQKRAVMEKGEKATPDIISTALESGAFSEDKLVDNMMTFLAAGHETTASAMSWATLVLCQHPDIQTRLRQEIRAHIDSLDSEIDSNVIDNIPYLHAFCQEILRFYPPVPLTIRDTMVDTTILGQLIPRGTKIIISPWAVNHSKEIWGEDADQFKPDRWMAPGQANSGGATSNYAFLTFLHGPRSCIGSKFAVAELACLLATFVGRYEFELSDPGENITIKGGITARPANGMKIKIKPVEGW